MAEALLDGDGDPDTDDPVTRWMALYGALGGVLPSAEDRIRFGMQRFPQQPDTTPTDLEACAVNALPEVVVAPLNASAVLSSLPPANAAVCPEGNCADNTISLWGATPASFAILSAKDALLAGDSSHRKSIIFVTDGAANCKPSSVLGGMFDAQLWFESPDDGLVPSIHAARAEGITTYVVGIGITDQVSGPVLDGEPNGVNAMHDLSKAALAGGAPVDAQGDPMDAIPEYYFGDSVTSLHAAISSILDQIPRCEIKLDPAPTLRQALLGLVELRVAGIKIDNLDASVCPVGADGWVWKSITLPLDTVEFCGVSCDAVAAAGIVDVEYVCIVD